MGVEHDAAVDPPLPCWVLCDVGQPELIRSAAVEVAADEVLRGSDVDEALALLSGRNALEPPLSHQLVDELPGDDDLPAQLQLSPHPPIAVHTPRLGVDLADQPSQPLPPQLARRR